MPLTHDNGDSEFDGSLLPFTGTTEHLERVQAVVRPALGDALRRVVAERRGADLTRAGFDNRL